MPKLKASRRAALLHVCLRQLDQLAAYFRLPYCSTFACAGAPVMYPAQQQSQQQYQQPQQQQYQQIPQQQPSAAVMHPSALPALRPPPIHVVEQHNTYVHLPAQDEPLITRSAVARPRQITCPACFTSGPTVVTRQPGCCAYLVGGVQGCCDRNQALCHTLYVCTFSDSLSRLSCVILVMIMHSSTPPPSHPTSPPLPCTPCCPSFPAGVLRAVLGVLPPVLAAFLPGLRQRRGASLWGMWD